MTPPAVPCWLDEVPAADRPLLTRLVTGIEHDERLLAESEIHPLINRLVLYQDDARHLQVRLHLSPGTRELVHHDHKYSFSVLVLRGAYVHVWRRRTGPGDFTSGDIPPQSSPWYGPAPPAPSGTR
ncbi:hypothetical protein [Streptomyces tsukubensis]|uniref:hypothetical protein n=1 Tax=Streptomyces tsukubensis TaxID=83656 RepID=UPI00344BFAAB